MKGQLLPCSKCGVTMLRVIENDDKGEKPITCMQCMAERMREKGLK